MNREELVERMAWQVRTSRDVRMAILDTLSEWEQADSERGEAAARVPNGGPALQGFIRSVMRRVEEIR